MQKYSTDKQRKAFRTGRRKIFRPADAVVILALVVLTVFTAYTNFSTDTDEDKGHLTAVVRKSSEIIFTADLSEIDEPYEVCVDEDFHVTVRLEKDAAAIAASDCEDKICVNTGTLTRAGQSAVCLPAEISLEIVGDGSSAPDAVVG